MSEKSLLIVNATSDVDVTFYIFPSSWHKRRFLAVSKIIKPGKNYLHRGDEDFRYIITVINKEKQKDDIVALRHWTKDLFYKITSFDVIEEKELSECNELKQICCKKSRDREISSEGFENLYEILELDMKKMRKIKEPEEIIKKAYKRQMLRWHPDKNPESGDAQMCQDIQRAYEILRDPELRATYHNVADYDKGWLYKARSIFWPEYGSWKQRKDGWKRKVWMAFSACLAIGGFALTIFTAGAGLAAVIVAGVLIGAGLQSLPHTVSRNAIEEGFEYKRYFASMGIGALGGAAFGGATAGIMAGMAGIHAAAVGTVTGSAGGGIMAVTNDFDRVATGEKVSIKEGLAHAAIGIVTGGLAGGAGGAVANVLMGPGAVGEAANKVSTKAKQIVSKMNPGALVEQTSLAVMSGAANLVEERVDDDKENKSIGDHATSIVCNVGKTVVKHTVKTAGKEAGRAMQNKTNDIKDTSTEENVEENVENENEESTEKMEAEDNRPKEKINAVARNEGNVSRMQLTCFENEAEALEEKEEFGREKNAEENNTNKENVEETLLGTVHANEKSAGEKEAANIRTEGRINAKAGSPENIRGMKLECFENEAKALKEKEEFGEKNAEEKNTNKENMEEAMLNSVLYNKYGHEQNPEEKNETENKAQTFDPFKYHSIDELIKFKYLDNEDVLDYENNKATFASGRIRYISEGNWWSRMLVKYKVNNETVRVSVSGSGEAIKIPANATNIEVRFEVMRFATIWCDVKKYDRSQKCWSEPIEPHIFKYDRPCNRTFTLAGSLYYEAVMSVTENGDELKEL